MGLDFTVFKGSETGAIVEAKGHRDPGPTEVIVKITHCGVCGTDEHFRHANQGLGHEGVGTIVELGSQVLAKSEFRVGDRVGMGWYHKVCGYCRPCLEGRDQHCINAVMFGSGNWDQGCFGTAVAWDVSALFKIPDEIESELAGPLMCGGATVFSPLYNSGARAGDRIGIIGVGGLGHLAIQFASKMGMEAVVFSSTEAKREEALKFGAAEFHVTSGGKKLEGIDKIDVLLITSNAVPAELANFLPLLAPGAKVYPLTISTETLPLSPFGLIVGGLTVIGSGVSGAGTLKAMLSFAAKHGVRPQIEKFEMSQTGVTDAMQKLRDGKMRYRGVLVV